MGKTDSLKPLRRTRSASRASLRILGLGHRDDAGLAGGDMGRAEAGWSCLRGQHGCLRLLHGGVGKRPKGSE